MNKKKQKGRRGPAGAQRRRGGGHGAAALAQGRGGGGRGGGGARRGLGAAELPWYRPGWPCSSVGGATGGRVVLSSSWRLQLPLPAIEGLLRAAGFRGELVDRTPRGVSRTAEILAWLRANDAARAPHAALDDEIDPDAEGFARVRWVVTRLATGLTGREVALAIEALRARGAAGG